MRYAMFRSDAKYVLTVIATVCISLNSIASEVKPYFNMHQETGLSQGADDSQELQKMIDNAAGSTVKTVKLALNKTYNLQHPLYFKSNVVFDGNGSTLLVSINWTTQNKEDLPALIIANQSNVQVKNLVLDIQGQNRKMQQRVYCGMLMVGAKKCTLDNVTFKNGGIKDISKAVPNSPHLMIVSQDAANDVNSLPAGFRSIVAESSDNMISNCKFLNPVTYARFGIRVLTNWELNRGRSNFVNKSERNTLKDSYFTGEYPWNTVEIAGGGTVNNLIQNNQVDGRSSNNLDIDKGASYNIVRGNTIKNAGLPAMLANDKNVRCSPIMVHGFAQGRYFAYGNVVENNIIQNVTNPVSSNSKYAYSSAIGASTVDGLRISNNQIINVYQDKSYRNGTAYGGGIVLDDACKNVKINSNTFNGVNYGIVYSNNGLQLNNISVDSNEINSNNTAILIPMSLKGQSDGVTINNNKIRVKAGLKNNAIKVGNFKSKQMLNNLVQ